MRSFGLIALMLVMACAQPSPTVVKASPTRTAVASICKLPVWWPVDQDIHAGFVSVPDGAFMDAGILPLLKPRSDTLSSVSFYGGAYLSGSKTWQKVNRDLVSPDGTEIAFWETVAPNSEIRVINLASHEERVIYRGTTMFIPIAFTSDGIYVVRAVKLKQGSFERLYRLDPAGGTPQLVRGSDRHMSQYGWVLMADGAAWGIDYVVQGSNSVYSLIRLDLSTATATTWMEGQSKLQWPRAVDSKHRLYAAPYDGPLSRIDSPGQSVELRPPEPMQFETGVGTQNPVVDSIGVWFSGQGGVWLFADGQEARKIAVPAGEPVRPAAPCT